MRKIQRVVFFGVVIVTSLVWGTAIILHRRHSPRAAQNILRDANPALAARIETQVADLKHEAVHQSIEKLPDVNMFSWPGAYRGSGYAYGLPLDPNQDGNTIQRIMSNRRFRKVLADLSQLDRSKAVKILGGELSNGIALYLPLYADKMRVLNERHRISDIDTNHSRGGLSFVNGTTNGAVVLLGARLGVLSLTWISGLLELHELKPQIDWVARLALSQRDEIYGLISVDPLAREQMLYMASLYNRQVLGYALFGVAEKAPERDAALEKSKLQVQQFVLAPFDSAVTEYDLPVTSGFMKPDRSSATVTTKFLSPATDEVFNDLTRALMAVP